RTAARQRLPRHGLRLHFTIRHTSAPARSNHATPPASKAEKPALISTQKTPGPPLRHATLTGAVTRSASTHPVELNISDLHQLFNSMDPSPFHERDLDDDAEEFITSWAREAPKDAPIRLIIHLAKPVPGLPDPQGAVANSIHHYFTYR